MGSLVHLSLEELQNVKVTSVSRAPESAFKAAAAITVLTNEDIKRSGATNIAEALRLVPGLNVARIDSNKWAISARGFNRQFSNKLLVQIDGRSVYTPLFSGVLWDAQDLILEDINRIEVIRGPGATMWGANAVNGIINIITKSSEFTQGKYVSSLYGNQERGTVSARYGQKLDDERFYRVYAKHSRKEESQVASSGLGNDDTWHQSRTGFRYDWNKSLVEKIKIQGEAYTGRENQAYVLPGLTTPGVSDTVNGDERVAGANILASWTKMTDSDSENTFQGYFDYIQRDMNNLLGQRRFTLDLDFQRVSQLDKKNQLIWGAGYRFFRDHINDKTLGNGQQYLDYEPEKSNNHLLSTFIQNKHALIDDELFLTLGSKFSHNYFSGFEIQPNARFSWRPQDRQTFWGAVSRAIRIPTKGERGLSSIAVSTPGGFVRQSANTNRNYDSEEVISYELGHRIQLAQWASLDTTIFYNEYDRLRTFETGVSGFNIPGTLFELVASNSGSAESHGIEISASISPAKNWKVGASYSYLELQMHTAKDSNDFLIAAKEGQSPEQQATLTSRYNMTQNIELDNSIYYVDELPAYNIQDYIRVDARIGWRPAEGVDLSIVGQNLFNKYHQEVRPSLYSRPADIGRSIYAKVALEF